MEYMVIGPDGAEYGPANLELLKSWVTEGRVSANSQLKEFSTGRTVVASSVPGLFEEVSSSVPYAHVPPPTASGTYPREGMSGGLSMGAVNEWGWGFWKVVLGSVAALVLFFIFGGFGIIFAAFSIYDAVRLKASGAQSGVVALIISIISTIIVLIGWFMRLQGLPI